MEAVYNKLVRDLIPDIIEADGKQAVISHVKDREQLRALLLAKLQEEIEEYGQGFDIEELADLLEIIHALVEVVHEEDFAAVENLRLEKKNRRGGFSKGIILEKVIS